MRFWKPGTLAAIVLLTVSAPVSAQYGVPMSSPGMLTTPEMAGGVMGAGAAGTATPSYCGNTGVGRDGPRYQCPQAPPPDARGRR